MSEMIVYLKPQSGLSKAMDRVAQAFADRLPEGAKLTESISEATHVILHVIGHPETVKAVTNCRLRGQRYFVLQYCLRTTQEPKTDAWLDIWAGADLVFSYYDLPKLCAEDGNPSEFKFYHAPLGVDADVFHPGDPEMRRKWMCLTSGTLAASESSAEVEAACRATDSWQLHLGHVADHKFTWPKTSTVNGITDATLAQNYQQCQFVSGLRRVEGFELPAAEGLLCGARPILFDRPHYRKWYDNWAYFIHEGNADQVTAQLIDLFEHGADPLKPEEREAAVRMFDWDGIIANFWLNALPRQSRSVVTFGQVKRKLLWVGDAIVSSGFAKCTHETLANLGPEWHVDVLGLNYSGDPYDREKHPYDVYPAHTGGDLFGVNRLAALVTQLSPDVVVIQNDPWNFPAYMRKVGSVPVVGIVAVDGLNCQGNLLNGLAGAIFWTKFGMDQAKAGGYTGPAFVVPLGVDLDRFRPMDRLEARKIAGLPTRCHNAFIVGNVNRNQPRKRLDLSVAYFAEWMHKYKVFDAYLYLHVCPTGDVGYDLRQLAKFYNISNRVIHAEPEIGFGITEDSVAITYNCFDLNTNTGQGEGFGLTAIEAMACDKPLLAGDWAGLGDWARDAAALVPCYTTVATPVANAIGGVPDGPIFIEALDRLYRDPAERAKFAERGRELVSRPEYRWGNIGSQVAAILDRCVTPKALQATG